MKPITLLLFITLVGCRAKESQYEIAIEHSYSNGVRGGHMIHDAVKIDDRHYIAIDTNCCRPNIDTVKVFIFKKDKE